MPRSKATSTPDRLPRDIQPRFTFVGGKGGVGKTTCAAAMALRFARAGAETLVISTDPAPSLGDVLGERLSARPRAVRGVPRLHGSEINAPRALDAWLRRRAPILEQIALRGTWLDRDDVSRLLGLSLPGIDEMAALLQIADLAAGARYARIVVDTAPTGHLLRMLELPAVMRGLGRVFDAMQEKHRVLEAALAGRRAADAADALVEELDADAARMLALLRDPEQTRLAWVTLPEPMAVEETLDALAWMRERALPVDTLVVNRVTAPPPGPCAWCSARRRLEHRAIARLRRTSGRMHTHVIPALSPEPRGVRPLARVARLLGEPSGPRAGETAPAGGVTTRTVAVMPVPRGGAPAERFVTPGTRLVMFGGKGGVGKTTCAAAAALDLAARLPGRTLLLLSVDPAHSLADALGQPLSDAPVRLPGGPRNLQARELDARRAYDRFRRRFSAAVEDLFARAAGRGSGSASAHDEEVIRGMLELAPPGLDELVAIVEVIETLLPETGGASDLVVMDTAPTGHALRLIEMPALVHEWAKALMAILLKYESVTGVGELGAVLLKLSQGLGRLRGMLADPRRTCFVAVTRAAALPRLETLRLLRRLARLSVHTPLVMVNAIGAGTCRRCRQDARAQAMEVKALLGGLARSRRAVVAAPAALPPPHGIAALTAWRGEWRSIPVRYHRA